MSPTRPVFSPQFLNAIGMGGSSWRTDREAQYAGPFRVVQRDDGFAVMGEGQSDRPLAVFREPQWALLAASTLGAKCRWASLGLSAQRDGAGRWPVLERKRNVERLEVAGSLSSNDSEILEAIHVAEYILRSPYRLASLLEAAGPSVLEGAAQILTHRLGLEPEHVDPPERLVRRYRLELVAEDDIAAEHVRPLLTGRDQAAWLAQVLPRSPIEIGGALYLDLDSCPIGYCQYQGALSSVGLDPRQIFAPALLLNAAALSVFHTHPESAPRPSPRDREWSHDIRCCGRSLRIPVLESIVLGAEGRFALIP